MNSFVKKNPDCEKYCTESDTPTTKECKEREGERVKDTVE